jgi:hypothetical protein
MMNSKVKLNDLYTWAGFRFESYIQSHNLSARTECLEMYIEYISRNGKKRNASIDAYLARI